MRKRWSVVIGVFAVLGGAASCGLDLAGMNVADDGGLDGAADGLAESGLDSGIGDAVNDNPFDVPADIGPCFDASLALCDDDAGCGAGTKCTPFVPPSWQIVLLTNTACSGAYPIRFTGLTTVAYNAPAATSCGCTGCGIQSPGVCNADASISTGAACANFVTGIPADNSCQHSGFNIALAAGDGIRAVQVETPPTCTAPAPTKTIPSFDGGAQNICTSNATGLCEFHSFCAPSTGAPVCIAIAGAQSCPSGFKTMFATGATDTRDCSTCTCGTTAGNCTGTMTLTTMGGCTNGNQTFAYDGGCIPGTVGSGWDHAQLGPGTPTGECHVADAGSPIGTVAPTNPITVCCQN